MNGLPTITEAEFTRQVLDLARVFGWRRTHSRPAMTSKGWRTAISGDAGFPDVVLCRKGEPGRLIIAELKVGRNKPTAEQLAWIECLRSAGVAAYVWRPTDWETIQAVLSENTEK